MEIIRWKKLQGAEDREVKITQEEHQLDADPDPENTVDLAVENADPDPENAVHLEAENANVTAA